MNGATSMAKGFVEPTPQGHRPKEWAHDTRGLAAAAIETARQRHPPRGLVVSVRFDSLERPRHDPSSNLAKQRTELSFKRHSGFGCRLGVDKRVKEPGAPGEQTRKLHDKGLKGRCQQGLEWRFGNRKTMIYQKPGLRALVVKSAISR